jgi:hypothetical protein
VEGIKEAALTERQQYWLKHIRACEGAGQTSVDYASAPLGLRRNPFSRCQPGYIRFTANLQKKSRPSTIVDGRLLDPYNPGAEQD